MGWWNRLGLGVRLLIVALVIYATTVSFLVIYGDETFSGGAYEETSEITDAAVRAANLITTTDQAVSMLFTVTVGILVGVGFVLRDRDFRLGLGHPMQLVLSVIFALAVISAVYFGYTARMHAITIARHSYIDYETINDFIARQAFAVVVAAGAALALFMLYVADRHLATPPAEVSPQPKRRGPRKPPSPGPGDR